MSQFRWLLVVASCASLAAAQSIPFGAGPGDSTRDRDVPGALVFIENAGQWEPTTRFMAHAGRAAARLEADGIQLAATTEGFGEPVSTAVTLRFEGASPSAIRPEHPSRAYYNFIVGNDPARWRSHVRGYGSVLYEGLHDGIDLRVRSTSTQLEYDLLLQPGADLAAFVVRVEGAEDLRIGADGALIANTFAGDLVQSPPLAWSRLPDGRTRAETVTYRLVDSTHFGFTAAERDPGSWLVLDPALEWSTYLGGTNDDSVGDMCLDLSGNIIVVGKTLSATFPTTPNALDTTCDVSIFPCDDAFVTRFTKDGQLIYSTFLGGTSIDQAVAVAVADSGDLVICGQTASPNFPVTFGGLPAQYPGVFIVRLAADGSSLGYSAVLGGNQGTTPFAMALDPSGDVIVGGNTDATNFPVTANAFDKTKAGSSDAFLLRLDASGTLLEFSTYLGGDNPDLIYSLTLDAAGNILLAGSFSGVLPITPGAFSSNPNGLYLARFSPDGSTILQSTYLGGNNSDVPLALGVDPAGNVYVAGWTFSDDFPVTPGAFGTISFGFLGYDGFITCFDPLLTSLKYSGILSAGLSVEFDDMHVDSAGQVTVAGWTFSDSYPTTPGAYDTSWNGDLSDGIVTRVSPDGSKLYYATYLGGTGADGLSNIPPALAIDETGAAFVAIPTGSTDFPMTAGAFQPANAGMADVAVAKLDMLPSGVSKYGASTPGCLGPLALGVTAMPKVGATDFGITCTNAPPQSTAGLLAIALQPLDTPIAAVGTDVWISPAAIILLLGVQSNELGFADLTLPIRNHPALVGFNVFTQCFWPDACGPSGWSASNALAITLQP